MESLAHLSVVADHTSRSCRIHRVLPFQKASSDECSRRKNEKMVLQLLNIAVPHFTSGASWQALLDLKNMSALAKD